MSDATQTPVPTPESNPVPVTPEDLVCLVRVSNGNVHQVALNKRQRQFILGALVHAQGGQLVLDKTPVEGMQFKHGRASEPQPEPTNLILPPGHGSGKRVAAARTLPPK